MLSSPISLVSRRRDPTFPCLLKRLLRSAARVLEDSPLTHRFLPEVQLAWPGERRSSAPLRQDPSTKPNSYHMG